MKITILTLFPEMFTGPFDHSIVKHATEKKLISITLRNIRDFGKGTHKMVDDTAYGGGVGMVLRVDVIHEAIEASLDNTVPRNRQRVVLLSARGKQFNQESSRRLSQYENLILICGHYEGVDERILEYIDEELSIGDFVLTGGEIPSMLITDSIVRLLPGVLKEGATDQESFSLKEASSSLLEYPHYTRPKEYQEKTVPEVLLSGNHKKIADWRQEQAKHITKKRRPDLLKTER